MRTLTLRDAAAYQVLEFGSTFRLNKKTYTYVGMITDYVLEEVTYLGEKKEMTNVGIIVVVAKDTNGNYRSLSTREYSDSKIEIL